MNKECPIARQLPKCIKEKCTWYLVHSKQCAIPLIASELANTRKLHKALANEAGYLKG